ncbi:MAG: lipocalin family protein [Flavobacteriaceae bacterium]|jgi:hypothetical protein|nr:lipocalin family protein [Flavobacteriaceae bacterium]
MKKILLTALSSVALCLSFVACSGDDDSTPAVTLTPPNSEKLIGKWVGTQILALDADGKVVSDESKYFPCPSSIEFKAGGVLGRTFYDYEYDFEEKKSICEPKIGSGKWGVDGKILTIEFNDVEEGEEPITIFTIETLSDNVLKLDIPLSEDLATEYSPNVVKLRHVLERL